MPSARCLSYPTHTQFLPVHLPVVVEVEVVERETEVLPAVRGRLRQAGRNELVVGQPAVVIHVHVPDLVDEYLMISRMSS